ncbi:MAG: Fe-S cluster assembly ATPase SufC [Candidatus Helarchaeota archaeon]
MSAYLLEIRNLSVKVEETLILKNINLKVPYSESYVLFGPNGSGKSTLLKAIMGFSGYKVINGTILFDGEDITNLPTAERVKRGISLAYQNPPEIKGIKLLDVFKFCLKKKKEEDLEREHYELIDRLKLRNFLTRNINVGFSGGERKRSEIVQMLLLKPRLVLLDEPDSGVDVESLRLISNEIQNYVTRTGSSALIVTHQGEILNHLSIGKACVLLDSTIYCYKNSREIFDTIKEVGFAKCIECQERGVEVHD